jgi:hypothetical protein
MTTAADVGYFEMRIAKVVGLAATERELFRYVVLQEVSGDRRLPSRSAGRRPSAWRLTLMGRNGLAR